MTSPSRREFVRRCGGAAAATLLSAAAGCASVVAVRVTPTNGVARIRVREHEALLRPNGVIRVVPDGAAAELLVLARADGQFDVLSSECTHQGCTVEAQGARLVCPCHGSTFDRAGAVVAGPAARPLPRYRNRLTTDGVIEINLADTQ